MRGSLKILPLIFLGLVVEITMDQGHQTLDKDVRRELGLTLQSNANYLQALHILTHSNESLDAKKKARGELKPLYENSITAAILTECLSIVLEDSILMQKLGYSKKFLLAAQKIITQLGNNELHPKNINDIHLTKEVCHS